MLLYSLYLLSQLRIFNRMKTNSGLLRNGFQYVRLSLDVSCTQIFFALETLTLQIFETCTEDHQKQPFTKT